MPTWDDLYHVSRLDHDGAGLGSIGKIKDLTGIERCGAIDYLNLENNAFSDISEIANISALAFLNLEGNPITSLAPLLGNSSEYMLIRAYGLDLNENTVCDEVPKMEGRGWVVKHDSIVDCERYFWERTPINITDSVLRRVLCEKAEYEDVRCTLTNSDVVAITSIEYDGDGFDNQGYIYSIEDITPMPALGTLNLPNNKLTDIREVGYLHTLTSLDIKNNQVTSLLALLNNNSREMDVDVRDNPLDMESVCEMIPALEEKGWNVKHDSPFPCE